MSKKIALAAVVVSYLIVHAGCGSDSPNIGGAADAQADTGVSPGLDASSSSDASVDAATDGSTPTFTVTRLPSPVNKVDLVLAIDNSASMADKQSVLSNSVADLVTGLVNPPCIDVTTSQPIASAMQPTDPLAACPTGSTRAFAPIQDLHIGLVSSSLGSFGADGCPDTPPAACTGPTPNSTSNDDHGHLVTRTDPCGTTDVPTYQSKGFLAWDPAQTLLPPGTKLTSDLVTAVSELIVGDGQLGCGFESQDESWYRFLLDPTPYQSIALTNNQVVVTGTDQTLLNQRQAFLRPDSLLAIIVVSDETDTSIKETSSYPLFAAPELHLPHPSSACGYGTATPTPAAACCYSCGETPPVGCTADPACSTSPSYTSADEDTSIRAFGLTSHKDRYGIEFFYPPSRYVTALTSPTVTDASGKTVPNPIYTNLDPVNYTGPVRDSSLVYYAAITGVPWQLIARQKNGTPDLVNGVSALSATAIGGFKTGSELALKDSTGTSTFWDDIAGDPEHYVAPKSPFMVESTVPRSGTDPITGAAISPTNTANGGGSAVGGGLLNDHERTIKNPPDDIEYACIFDLPTPRDCTTGVACDCPSSAATSTDNPLCNGTSQVKGKAYPAIKELAIAKGMGQNGIVASICSKQISDPSAADYGYRPATQSIVSGVSPAFHRQCLAQPLTADQNGALACVVVEATHTAGACTCDPARARATVAPDHQSIVTAAKADPLFATSSWNCFCEVAQLSGAPLTDCETNLASTSNGWCYVDAAMGASQKAVVSTCPASSQREVRFVGAATPSSSATMFLGCN